MDYRSTGDVVRQTGLARSTVAKWAPRLGVASVGGRYLWTEDDVRRLLARDDRPGRKPHTRVVDSRT